MIRNFLQKATIGVSFDVCWSLVAQAVPENEPFLSKLSIFRNRYQKIVCHCPPGFPPGYYWYGASRHSEGNLPKWVERLANDVDEYQKEPCKYQKELHNMHDPTLQMFTLNRFRRVSRLFVEHSLPCVYCLQPT